MNGFKIALLIAGISFFGLESFAQVQQDWLTRIDSLSGELITVDKIGNIYVAGSVYRVTSGVDISLVKYNSSGNEQWIKEYNGIGSGLDAATAIALDTSGNIFITGYSFRGPVSTNDEIITIKYNTDGDTLWVRHYNSPGNKIDRAFALEVDSSGNSYVGGYLNNISFGNVYGNDYITIKYDPNGTLLWATQMHVGDGSVTDLKVDPAGNIYVTGLGFNSTLTGHDYITVKYNSVGDSLWGNHYGGLGSDPSNKATGIAIDEIGNVYITGFSTGSNGYYDYATIKYSETGMEQWVSRYDGPINEDDKAIGLVVDKNQNVFVTGEASVVQGASYIRDFATIKYNSDGDSLWVRYYGGPGGLVDRPTGMTIDSIGNIYITGSSSGIAGYTDYATIKYNSNGDELWIQNYNAADLEDVSAAIAVDESGNIYVTGTSWDNFNYGGSVTIKYSQSVTPYATNTQIPDLGIGSTTSFGNTLLTFIGDVTVSDSVTIYYYLEPVVPGELPSGIIWIGNYFWRVVNSGLVFTNGHLRISTEDLVGVTVGGCGACLVWLKRSNSGDPWQNLGGIFDGTLESGYLTSNIPFDSFSEFAIGSTEDPTFLESENSKPETFMLGQNYPNPFNPSTTINFSVPTPEFVTLKVYDVLGNEVATLLNEEKPEGSYEVVFDSHSGLSGIKVLTSGIYFYKLQAGSFVETRKMILLK